MRVTFLFIFSLLNLFFADIFFRILQFLFHNFMRMPFIQIIVILQHRRFSQLFSLHFSFLQMFAPLFRVPPLVLQQLFLLMGLENLPYIIQFFLSFFQQRDFKFVLKLFFLHDKQIFFHFVLLIKFIELFLLLLPLWLLLCQHLLKFTILFYNILIFFLFLLFLNLLFMVCLHHHQLFFLQFILLNFLLSRIFFFLHFF